MAKLSPMMLLPVAVFAGFAGMAAWALMRDNPDVVPSVMVGREAPSVGATTLPGKTQLTDEMLQSAEPLEWMRQSVAQISGRLEILATRLTGECAIELGVEKGLPVLTLDRTLWCDGRALSHSRRVYPPGHRVSFAR